MIIAIKDFYDKTTGKTIKEQTLIKAGTLIKCTKALAEERVKLGVCIEVLNPDILKETSKKSKKEDIRVVE